MRSGAALVLLALVLAGCAQPAPKETPAAAVQPRPADPFHPNATAASGALGAPELAAPKAKGDITVAQPGFAEPNVAAAYDGRTLYIGNPGATWRSDDGGASWKKPANTGLEGGGDGDIAVDAKGTLYYLGLLGKEKRRVPFLTSHDGGESWSPAIDISAGRGVDREWIDVTPDGRVFATWRGDAKLPNATDTGIASAAESAPEIEYNGSPDGGATWTGLVKVGPDGDGGPITHDPVTGTLAIPVIDQAEPVSTAQPLVHMYTSRDQGASWAAHDVAKLGRSSPVEPNGYASDFPVAAFDGSGTLYLVYSADSATTPGGVTPPEELGLYGIFLQASHDQGATWSKPQLLSDKTKDARFPWIAAGAPGRLAIVWYENVQGAPGELVPDAWNVKLYESLTGGEKGVTATLTSQPNHVGALCTSGTGCVAADRSMLDFFEVAIGKGGQPLVAYASSVAGLGFTGQAVKRTEIHFVTTTGTSLL